MIISASRRTDIPAFYSPWFFNRIREKYVLVPNPYNPKIISRISLDPSVTDCIVFWTKNPAPMLGRMEELKEYNYYFQFTLNPYGREIENRLPPLQEKIDIFRRLADRTGPEKVIWRYDPLLTNERYTPDFHQEKFSGIAAALKGYTEKCMLGFIDHYSHIRKVLAEHDIKPLEDKDIYTMAAGFKRAADVNSIGLETCSAKMDLMPLGIPGGACVDGRMVEKIAGYPVRAKKDKNQRDICRCMESIDIGMYESCLNGCIYCYAVRGNYRTARIAAGRHDKNSPMLIGRVKEGDIIKEREAKSLRRDPFSLF